MAQINTDLSNVQTQDAFEIVPPGWYEATVDDSEICTAKSSGNQYIKWTFTIDGKPNKIWTNTMLNNEVSMRILKTMAACCGHRNPNYIADTEELHGRRCQIKIAIEKDPNGDYEPKNVIKGFKASSIQSTVNIPPAHVIENAPKTANNVQAKMPWDN